MSNRTLRYLLDPFAEALADPRTTEVVVNRCGQYGVEADGQWSWHDDARLTLEYLDSLGILAAFEASQDLDASNPLCAATLPGGERIQICRPPATLPGVISLTIRKPSARTRRPDDGDFSGMFDETNAGKTQRARSDEALMALYEQQDWREFLRLAVKVRKTICVTGATGAGKTDVLKRLLMEIPETTRVVTIEDTAEFGPVGPPNRVSLFYGDGRAKLSAEDVLRAALRMRPDRIVVQECRGPEAWGFIRALAAGHPGGCTSWHADEGMEWDALELMVKQHEAGRTLPDIRKYLQQYIDVVVWLARGESGFKAPPGLVEGGRGSVMKSAVFAVSLTIAFPAFSQPISVPGPAAQAGYTEMTFGPTVTMGKTWRMWTDAAAVQQNSDGSVIIRGGGNGYNAQIATATPNSDGTYNGTAFGGGGYFEATLSFLGTPVMDGGWPSFWANDIENQIQGTANNGASQWSGQPSGFVNSIEVDFLECMTGSGSYGIAMHNWYGQQSAIQKVSSLSSGSPVSLPSGTDTSKPHKYGFLWVPASGSSKGTGRFFFDGKQVGNTISWNQYNPNTPPPPVEGDTAFSVLDSRNLYLILGTGPSNPMTVTSVTAWQKPGAGSSPLGKMTNNITTAQAQINGSVAFDKAMLQIQGSAQAEVTQQPTAAPGVGAPGPSPSPSPSPSQQVPSQTPTSTISKGVRPSSVATPISAPIPVGTATLAPQSSSFTMPADAQSRIADLETELQTVQQEIAALKQDIAASSGTTNLTAADVAKLTPEEQASWVATGGATTTYRPPSANGKQQDDPDVPGAEDD